MSQSGTNLRVTLAQDALHWHDPGANRRHFAELLAPLAGTTDLVVLPEMFTTGFTMEPGDLAETMPGPTTDWMSEQARRLDAAVTGSVIVTSAAGRQNRLLFAQPDGHVSHYDKRHLFRMGGEHKAFAPGRQSVVVDWRGFRVGLLVCYDLRFPVWSRRRPAFDYDLLLYVANWPSVRAYAWTQLLRARAIENQAYVLGVNRVGRDGHGVPHAGGSAAIDYLGQPLLELGNEPGTGTVTLSLDGLRQFREKFPAQLDADDFEITV
jgi:predicted amidohydrolase